MEKYIKAYTNESYLKMEVNGKHLWDSPHGQFYTDQEKHLDTLH